MHTEQAAEAFFNLIPAWEPSLCISLGNDDPLTVGACKNAAKFGVLAE